MLKTHMAACLVATMLAAPAFAQAPASPAAPSGGSNPSTTAPAMPSATAPAMPGSAMSGSFMTKIEPTHILASELIGTKVISANNESVGDINDVIVDRNGQAIAAVVGVGGFLGIGEKDVAVPFKVLEFATREQVSAMSKNNVTTTGSTTANSTVNAPATAGTTTATDDGEPERVILRMTKAELQAAPAFDTDRDATKTGTTTGTSGTSAPMTPATPAPKP